MLGWLKRKSKERTPALPTYTALRIAPTRQLPHELVGIEQTSAFRERSTQIQTQMRDADPPSDDQPLFVELVTAAGGGLTIPSPEFGGRCLVVFTSPFRAGDYVQQYFAHDHAIEYMSSSATQLAQMLRDIRAHDIGAFVLDRCPRCEIGVMFGSENVATAADVLTVWAIVKSSQYARAEFYMALVMSAAGNDDLHTAREVLLELVGHVMPEDPRLHYYLGQIAAASGDDCMLREAKSFLQLFDRQDFNERLDRAAATGRLDFDLE